MLQGGLIEFPRPLSSTNDLQKLVRAMPRPGGISERFLQAISSGNFEQALPYASKAVETDPGNFTAHYSLGRIYLELNQGLRAVKTLETAAQIAPDSPSVQFALARAYTRAKRPAEAARARTEFARLEALDKKRRGEATGEDNNERKLDDPIRADRPDP